MERLRDMLHTKFSGWVDDVKYASENTANYKIEENETSPGKYILRRPLLSQHLLVYQSPLLSFREDFTAVCEERQPKASQMFALADALYNFLYWNWFDTVIIFGEWVKHNSYITVADEEWQLEDRSKDTLTVDTGCLQLLADALDNPMCPLDDLPPETVQQRQQCRQQLWDDMVQRSPHIPVTSYLAYTQRTNVHLCLLAWMAVNSLGICHDVPFSMIQSVHDARCYFDSPHDQSCPEPNATDAICSVSRAVLLLKCHDFSTHKSFSLCAIGNYYNKTYLVSNSSQWEERIKGKMNPTKTTLNHKHSLSSATLTYKDFKIDRLKSLEISFIAVNIVFRFLTAGVYLYLPHCRNLPGKILLSFQITVLIQILCSEVMYRIFGVPHLSVMVLIDTALTLLSSLLLNLFCYQMYACIRHLRLPNDLLPAEASRIFRCQVLCAVIPWSMVCTACATLEYTCKYYLIYSRVVFVVAISLSVTFNSICLGLVAFIYRRNKTSMSRLKIYSEDKFASKTQLVFISAKTVIISGIGIIIRIGFHQAQGIAQFVYYVHIATMVQGPVLFVLFVCNGTTLPVLKERILAWWDPGTIRPGQELGSAAERNLVLRRKQQSPDAETSV